jgi:hypothetical protein
VRSVNNPHATPLVFEVETHDDLLETVERVRNANIVSEGEAPALAIGLKLLGEVIIRHRDEPQFAELWNVVPAFIKRLKAR